jgi:ribonuclease VapC
MILDTSAIVAIVLREPGFELVFQKLAAAKSIGVGAPTLAEAGIVLRARLGRDPIGILGRFLQKFEIVTVPFGEEHWRESVEAYGTFGRGQNTASLNFGDCMTYAVAKLAAEPLLFVGKDFSRTDLEIA